MLPRCKESFQAAVEPAFACASDDLSVRMLLLLCRPHSDLQQISETLLFKAIRGFLFVDPGVWSAIHPSLGTTDRSATQSTSTPTKIGSAFPTKRSNRRVERMDAVHHPHLPLYWSVQSSRNIRIRPTSGGLLPFHDGIRARGVLLPERRLHTSPSGFGSRAVKSPQLCSALHHAYGLFVLLFRSTSQFLVLGHLLYHENRTIKQLQYKLPPRQDFCICDSRQWIDTDPTTFRDNILRSQDNMSHTLGRYGMALPRFTGHFHSLRGDVMWYIICKVLYSPEVGAPPNTRNVPHCAASPLLRPHYIDRVCSGCYWRILGFGSSCNGQV